MLNSVYIFLRYVCLYRVCQKYMHQYIYIYSLYINIYLLQHSAVKQELVNVDLCESCLDSMKLYSNIPLILLYICIYIY